MIPPYAPSLPDWMRQVATEINRKTDVTTISAAPARGNWDSILTAFTGDVGNPYRLFGRTLTGDALGTLASGYRHNPETAVLAGYVFNESGHNEDTASNDGRTNGHWAYVKVDNQGQGDLSGITFEGFVDGGLPGASHFLANPAVVFVNGTATAGDHGLYLNPFEVDLQLNGKDAAAVGYVTNITRDTGDTVDGLGAYTSGFRAQSHGSYPVDSMLSGGGSFKYGVDLCEASYSGAGAPSFTIAAIRTPDVTYKERTAASVPNPAAGYQTLFIDSADNKLKRKNSAGTVTIIA